MRIDANPVRLYGIMLAALLFTQAAYAFYNPPSGRWLNRDPINEPGHGPLVSGPVSVLTLPEENNLNGFVRDNPISLHDPDGRLVGYIIAAIAAATYACAKPQYDLAMSRYEDSGDKFKHCWVSCRISKSCLGAFAELAGLGKEARDSVIRLLKGSHDDPWIDSLQDLQANQQCIGWESGIIGLQWIGALCRRSCEDCCKEKVGYYTGEP
jgi:hypothetical protein